MKFRVVTCVLILAFALAVSGCGAKPAASSPGTARDVAASPESGGADSPESDAPPAELHTPEEASPERIDILRALQGPVGEDLGQKVVFRVITMNSEAGYAFVQAQPLNPDDTEIDYLKTKYKPFVENDAFDDRVDALLQYHSGSWKVLAFDVGSTDVGYLEWSDTYGAPKDLMGL